MSSDSLVVLDTETTGMGGDAEVVQTGVAQRGGGVLVDSLVNPTRPVPRRQGRHRGSGLHGEWRSARYRTVQLTIPPHKNLRRAYRAGFVTEREQGKAERPPIGGHFKNAPFPPVAEMLTGPSCTPSARKGRVGQ